MSKSMDPDVIALEQDEEWPYHVVEYILLSPCPDAKGWTCGFLRMRSDLTSTRGLKNKTPPMVTPCYRQKRSFTKPNACDPEGWT